MAPMEGQRGGGLNAGHQLPHQQRLEDPEEFWRERADTTDWKAPSGSRRAYAYSEFRPRARCASLLEPRRELIS
jgi:hypothetical protein